MYNDKEKARTYTDTGSPAPGLGSDNPEASKIANVSGPQPGDGNQDAKAGVKPNFRMETHFANGKLRTIKENKGEQTTATHTFEETDPVTPEEFRLCGSYLQGKSTRNPRIFGHLFQAMDGVSGTLRLRKLKSFLQIVASAIFSDAPVPVVLHIQGGLIAELFKRVLIAALGRYAVFVSEGEIKSFHKLTGDAVFRLTNARILIYSARDVLKGDCLNTLKDIALCAQVSGGLNLPESRSFMKTIPFVFSEKPIQEAPFSEVSGAIVYPISFDAEEISVSQFSKMATDCIDGDQIDLFLTALLDLYLKTHDKQPDRTWVSEEIRQWKNLHNPLLRFIQTKCDKGGQCRESTNRFLDYFFAFCQLHSLKCSETLPSLSRKMSKLGHANQPKKLSASGKERRKSKRFYQNIRISDRFVQEARHLISTKKYLNENFDQSKED